MSIRKIATCCAALFAIGFVAFAADEKKFNAKCVVSGAAAKEDKTADYRGGKVYLCCDNCPKAFAKDTKKFAVKANAQLVETGQATQVKCPLSGAKLNPEQTVMVGDVKVQFCCGNCKGKVAEAKGDAQAELVFSDTAFDKGFEVKKK